MANNLLLYSNGYWEEKLGSEFRKNNLENKLHLIFSLLVFLEISLAQFLLIRTHYGHAVLDPTSLAAHKGLLARTWDVNKLNYAAAKALVRHSLITRLMHLKGS